MNIWYFLLSHLLADYALQPASLVKCKYHSWQGILLHVIIHFLTLAFFFKEFLTNPSVLFAIAFICVTHFFIDHFKISYERKSKKILKAYWMDQLAHVTILIVASFFIPQLSFSLFPGYVLFYLILALFATLFWEISAFQFRRRRNPELLLILDYPQMFLRLLLITLSFCASLSH